MYLILLSNNISRREGIEEGKGKGGKKVETFRSSLRLSSCYDKYFSSRKGMFSMQGYGFCSKSGRKGKKKGKGKGGGGGGACVCIHAYIVFAYKAAWEGVHQRKSFGSEWKGGTGIGGGRMLMII